MQLENAFLSWRDVARANVLKMLPSLRPHQSIDQYLRRFFSDARIRLAFSFQSKYLGMSPFRCPSLFSILSFLEYEYGVFHPLGGCGAVTAALARVAERLGVKIQLDEPVEEILITNRRATGVRTARGPGTAETISHAWFSDRPARRNRAGNVPNVSSKPARLERFAEEHA